MSILLPSWRLSLFQQCFLMLVVILPTQLCYEIYHLQKESNTSSSLEEKIGTQWVYRFATHPRFAYWAFNMTQRKHIPQHTGIFLKQNPGEAHPTTEEIKQMASTNNIGTFTSEVSRYLGNISGSDAYWPKAKKDLKAVISHDGLPTFFLTFSSADMHWPELHAPFGHLYENLLSPECNCQNAEPTHTLLSAFYIKTRNLCKVLVV